MYSPPSRIFSKSSQSAAVLFPLGRLCGWMPDNRRGIQFRCTSKNSQNKNALFSNNNSSGVRRFAIHKAADVPRNSGKESLPKKGVCSQDKHDLPDIGKHDSCKNSSKWCTLIEVAAVDACRFLYTGRQFLKASYIGLAFYISYINAGIFLREMLGTLCRPVGTRFLWFKGPDDNFLWL